MEPNLKKLFEKAQGVSLSEAERTALTARVRALPRAVRSPYSFFSTRLVHQGVAAVLVVTLAGAGTALASSSALPGDVLFPVKIHVNERVETLLAVTPEAQAQVAVVQASRRLLEAEELVHKGRLTEDLTREIEDDFMHHAEVVQVRVRALRDSKKDDHADEVEKHFNERMDSHLDSFVKLESGEGSTTPGVRGVRDALERQKSRRGRDRGEDRKEEVRGSDSEDVQEVERPQGDDSRRSGSDEDESDDSDDD